MESEKLLKKFVISNYLLSDNINELKKTVYNSSGDKIIDLKSFEEFIPEEKKKEYADLIDNIMITLIKFQKQLNKNEGEILSHFEFSISKKEKEIYANIIKNKLYEI